MVAKIKLKFKESDLRRAEAQIIAASNRIIETAIAKMDRALFAESLRLANVVRQSPEFQALNTPALIGRFGFTPAEVNRLDDMFDVIAPRSSTEITRIEKNIRRRTIQFDWVDFDRLKEHPVGDHPLTKFNPNTRTFQNTGTVVSFIQWWEEGVTIRGHIFTRGNQLNIDFSRSGQGLMQERDGGFFMLSPTRIFEKTGDLQAGETRRNILKAFRTLVAREGA